MTPTICIDDLMLQTDTGFPQVRKKSGNFTFFQGQEKVRKFKRNQESLKFILQVRKMGQNVDKFGQNDIKYENIII